MPAEKTTLLPAYLSKDTRLLVFDYNKFKKKKQVCISAAASFCAVCACHEGFHTENWHNLLWNV